MKAAQEEAMTMSGEEQSSMAEQVKDL